MAGKPSGFGEAEFSRSAWFAAIPSLALRVSICRRPHVSFLAEQGIARASVLKTLPHPVVGADDRSDAIHFRDTNARAAGIGHLPGFRRRDVADFRPPEGPPGVMICSPPYGERIGAEQDLVPLDRGFGEMFRKRCPGWKLFLFTPNAILASQLGMKAANLWEFFNGAIPCRLLEYRNEGWANVSG